MNNLFFKRALSRRNLIVLLCSVVFGLLMMLSFSGKSRTDIETIAVSADEEYVACFETGREHRIRCFRADGTLVYDFSIPYDISAGGYCTLWFEDQMLCVLFYRTETVAYLSMNGTIIDLVDYTAEDRPPEFASFSRAGRQYIYSGDKIDVIYNKRGFLGYWFFGAERYLAITPKGETINITYTWTAK